MLRKRRRSARMVAAVAATLAMTAGSVSIASPAHAEVFPWGDSFEVNPETRWEVGQIAGFTSVQFITNRNLARIGDNFVRLNAVWDLPALASVFTTSTPDSTTPRNSVCTPEVYAWASSQTPRVDLFLRVRRGGRTGAIISNRGLSMDENNRDGWIRMPFGSIPWQTSTFTVEISAYNGPVLIDDVNIFCT